MTPPESAAVVLAADVLSRMRRALPGARAVEVFVDQALSVETAALGDQVIRHEERLVGGVGVLIEQYDGTTCRLATDSLTDRGIDALVRPEASEPGNDGPQDGLLPAPALPGDALALNRAAFTDAARGAHPHDGGIRSRAAHHHRVWAVAHSDGRRAGGHWSGSELTVRCQMAEGARKATGQHTVRTRTAAGRADEAWDPAAAGRLAAASARHVLDSVECRPGFLPVIFAPAAGGVFVHEVCGHALEADVLERGSVLRGRSGQRLGPEGLTVVDDPLLPGGWGSYTHDHEGAAASPVTLLDRGRLTGCLTTRDTAGWSGRHSTGHARRPGHRHPALPRMSNTYALPGTQSPEQILADTAGGLYVSTIGGAEVSPSSGAFSVLVREGFLIEHGRKGRPVSGVRVMGEILSTLRDIDRVGDDVRHRAVHCRKAGRWEPAGVGQPTLRVKALAVAPGGAW
ncbi:TldD/PmbA family protein [Streptomyces sp. NPDC052107]|uniref:TldD/PmbA family protein n=1 Tax=Streptomyces sp. NPDC052107 TaxID=3155632 RepID=UPI0034353771